MIEVPPEQVVEMAPEELGLIVLADLISSKEWNEWNYLNEANRSAYRGRPATAIAGALAWLRGQGFVGRDPSNSSDSSIVVSPAGQRAAVATK